MKNIIFNFWYGRITLWKSYWLVGELLNAIIIMLIYTIEVIYLKNMSITKQLPFLNFIDFHFINKIILILWTLFMTTGIWRAAEKYKGSIIWTILTLIFLSYRIFTLRLIFF